ncbi:MAG: sigma-54-dependent Fis family transcriptional regulator [Deltaproteobacteria bacterium]|nr:sigma-54-dependent Fis family transcriptional regulator [Deltaproteobacteria bacterium]
MRESNILVVDDEELYRRALERILVRVGHNVATARDATSALEIVSGQPIDLVLADVKMPGINGLELVRQIHEFAPDLPCIVITGFGSPESSVEALKAGAYWYLEKPFDQGHLDVVRRLVEQAIEHGRLKSENRLLQGQLQSRYRFENIIGSSSALRSVLETVSKVALTESTVLITGESGTGKELVARAIHFNSKRADKMFVTVNCGAIPEELLESELFGHVRGAFTNAVANREGRFSVAHEGTIFLDEIGDMSSTLQVKLLRVLQDRTFEPVGSSKTQSVDVRVIAATNQDLEDAIAERRFREDLFYRLNVIPIVVPPLRERQDDIPLLAQHFLDIANEGRGNETVEFSDEVIERMTSFGWPGNVRELENLVERLVTLCSAPEIVASDLPKSLQVSSPPPPTAPQIPPQGLSFRDVVDQFESDLILQALEITHGNKNRAAQLIRMNRTTMLEKMKKKGVKFDGTSRDSTDTDGSAPTRDAGPETGDIPDPQRSH